MARIGAIAALLAVPLCAACRRPCRADAVLCEPCMTRLRSRTPPVGNAPAGLDGAWSCAEHDGVARDLVRALKFGRLTAVAELIAERIALLAPPHLLDGSLVAVPPSSLRLRARGFDPAAEIAIHLARLSGRPLAECLRRSGSRRQVGRSRAQRLADPPRVRAPGAVPPRAVLVDDVTTTGATLAACARALRDGGAERVTALTFARRR